KYKGKSLNASFGFRGKEIITMIPCVVYNEEQDIPETEGIQIVLNGDYSVSFNMTMTELVYTKYILEKTDFIVMATHVLTTIGKPDKISYVNMDAKKVYNTYEHSAEAPNTESMGANNSVAKLLNRGVPTVEDDLYNL
ncbi:MAG: hypothetical protein ACRCXX_01355, partial [Cetobacterium sp.]|uniref:hypothetical protein n=1 Tax=Cetobacterium sp. TaxID=2071632 RepID=UPI003F322F83